MADNSVEKDLQKEFADRVVAIGRILPMLEPWHDPGYVKRAWCLFELYTAIQRRSEVEIDIILSPKQAIAFRNRINQDGSDARAIDEALAHVQSENAEATFQADLDAIRALILQHSGGFGTLNATVKQYLRRWFVSVGGVRVVARAGRASSSNNNRTTRSKVEHLRARSQGRAETSFAASTSTVSAPRPIEVEGAQTATDVDGSGSNADSSGLGSLIIARRDGEPWGMGVKPDPIRGVVVTKIKPGGAGARHNLEVGSTFTKIDGADALRIDKAELLHTLQTKTTIAVELGPVVQNLGDDHRAVHYYLQTQGLN